MTRINVVPVTELCDQHLLAEHREITRIPNCIARGRYDMKGKPDEYVLGTGHVKFFYDRLMYLAKRHAQLHRECLQRGFNVSNIWPSDLPNDPSLWLDYEPTSNAVRINRERIQVRMPNKARYTKV